MKILHTSDIHIGSPLTARLDPLKISQRKRELIESFRLTVDLAKREGCEGYIIAGDLFDSEKVGVRTLGAVISIIAEASDITFFYLPGNHEKDRLSSITPLPENLKVFGEDWTYFTLSGVTLAGRSEIRSDMFESLTLDKNQKNIVVLHATLADKTDDVMSVGRSDLKAKPIDYLALGHYHSYNSEMIGDRCCAVYSGTPEGRGFDEAGDKGVVILNTENDGIAHTFYKTAYRTLHIVQIPLDSLSEEYEIEELAKESLKGIPSTDLVRLVLVGRAIPELVRDKISITKRFENDFYLFEVKDEARLLIRKQAYENDRSLKGEFIRLVMSENSLSESEKEQIISCGLLALMGEE